jgi:multidrug efflux pump subunit AcrA (membrane-fusion protein)
VIHEPRVELPDTTPTTKLEPEPRPAHVRRPPFWRRRRALLAALGVLLLTTIGVVALSPRPTAPPPPAGPASTSLVAHGQVVPFQQARVGTLGGGVVQDLHADLGSEVAAQTPLAWVNGPSGMEIVTAPFSGAVTNVFVHAGDTLVPGATIAVVANMHTLQVETSDVDEFLIGHVGVGQRVQITVDALDNLAFTGTVTNVSLVPQAALGGNQAYPVIVSLGSVPPAVHAGMSVRITLPG